MDRSQTNYYTKLKRKIIVTTLCFSLVPLAALGLSMYHFFRVSYTSKTMDNLRVLVENRCNAIDLFLEERASQLYIIANSHSFTQLEQKDNLDRVFTLIQARSKSFIDLGVIDGKGHQVGYVGPYSLQGLNYKDEEWFHEVMMRGIYISDVFLGYRKFPHLIIAVMRREGKQSWILRATIDTAMFEAMTKAAQVGEKGDAFIVNEQNILQTTPKLGKELLHEGPVFSYPRSQGTVVQKTEMGAREVLVGSAWLSNKRWLLIVTEDPAEELIPLLRARQITIAIGLLGLVLIVTGTILVARAMVTRLVRIDHEKAALDASLIQSGKMAALGKLAAGIAHEVNNPLAVIKEKAGWMRDLLAEEDIAASQNFAEFQKSIDKIDQHAERAKKVVHRFLGFARRMEPVSEMVDVNGVIDDTITLLENEARFRDIDIQTDFDERIPRILSDSAQLQQVFLNILSNAIDAIGKNGEITAKTSYASKEKEVVVQIADNGPGIPKESLEKIFDPFFSTKEVGKGTGLGLSISYSIIEKLGGRIMVASEEKQGAKFTICLPVREERVGLPDERRRSL